MNNRRFRMFIAFWIWIALMAAMVLLAMPDKSDAFQVNFRITTEDFKDRNWGKVLLGGLLSFGTHELGHFVAGEAMGMDASFQWDGGPVVYADDYTDKSDGQKALFHSAGFISQALVGTALTAIDKTRHSDYSLGFTGFTFGNNVLYGVTGGFEKEENSDVYNLNDLGYYGNEIAIGAGLYSGVLTIINLNKYQEDQK